MLQSTGELDDYLNDCWYSEGVASVSSAKPDWDYFRRDWHGLTDAEKEAIQNKSTGQLVAEAKYLGVSRREFIKWYGYTLGIEAFGEPPEWVTEPRLFSQDPR